ncbi:hypothetical protein [Methylosinus sp. PW1]|uniref:hypothetical protein n=1 Tax=Methylosinus sp. PW1 TaxID=107636 RepID=UPI00055A71BF|nr:hypothetical protein [Methylosinus sp. PW1]
MGKFLVYAAYAAAVGAIALGLFLHEFPHPDRTTATIAVVIFLVACAPAFYRLWADLKKVYVPPKD